MRGFQKPPRNCRFRRTFSITPPQSVLVKKQPTGFWPSICWTVCIRTLGFVIIPWSIWAHVLRMFLLDMQSVVLWSMSSERQGPVYYAMLIHASHSRRGCPNLTLRLPLTNQLLVGVYVHFCICRPALCGKKKLRSGACIMASPGATWHPPHSQTVVLGMLGAKLTKPSYLLRCMDSVPKKHAA